MKYLQIIQNKNNLIFRIIFIFCLNFDKASHSFLHRFLLLWETDFQKYAALKNE